MTRDEAKQAAAAAVAERDNIQANLLDLDGSFGKRLLAGARLTGATQQRWATASADMAGLWTTFSAYSAVVDRAAELAASLGRGSAAKVAEITGLLTGPSVRLAQAPAPLGQRELTTTTSTDVTLAVAVARMRNAYSASAAVCAAAEAIWNEISDGLQHVAASVDQARQLSAGLADADGELASAISVAQANLGQLRETLNGDPLALGPAGAADNRGMTALAGLRHQADAALARATELDRLRADGMRRIASTMNAVAAATDAWRDALAAQQRAASRIADPALAPLPDVGALAGRLAAVRELHSAGRWSRLATELDSLTKDTAAAEQRCREAERAATGALERRSEMRGLLDAYQAKAAQLGAAEDAQLGALYEQARAALWTAPCDMAAAAAAVRTYQQAVLALAGPGGRS
jgi:hypothetical protein